ncbi:low molecular weight phosphatase family protein [Curtobacterium sp. RRHDQ10]|uniref:arsenate reductase/protein-tyrosine-phosphatase family protein n=1 Tax=Curtobacterium phyllosphaerae TaxID=3413379 RepID=UPI003BF0053B
MTAAGAGSPRPATVLFVCTGNICRSPLGAQLLVARLGDAAGSFDVRSAGTYAEDGAPMDAAAAAQSERLGGHPAAHASTPLSPERIAAADLVLTADRTHRAAVVGDVPRASRTTFTILQAARLIAGLEPEDRDAVDDVPSLVAAMAVAKSYVAPVLDPSDDDVEDPYRRSTATHERVADRISDAVDVIADALRATVAEVRRS